MDKFRSKTNLGLGKLAYREADESGPIMHDRSPGRRQGMGYKTDIEIAREASKKPIQEIGAKLGIPSDDLLPYGHDKAKVSAEFIAAQAG